MILSDRRFLGLMGWGCALFLLLVAGWVGVCLVNRPPYLMPDTTSFDTGDIFFSVGDSWESVAVRALSGTSSWEVIDSTPSHCGIVVRDARGVRLAHASTAAGKIVVETPEEYLRNNGSYCIYAVKPPCPVSAEGIRQTVDSLVAHGVKFDFDFDHTTPDALYCTEMVVTVFEANSCSVFSSLRQQSYIYPNDLLLRIGNSR